MYLFFPIYLNYGIGKEWTLECYKEDYKIVYCYKEYP